MGIVHPVIYIALFIFLPKICFLSEVWRLLKLWSHIGKKKPWYTSYRSMACSVGYVVVLCGAVWCVLFGLGWSGSGNVSKRYPRLFVVILL